MLALKLYLICEVMWCCQSANILYVMPLPYKSHYESLKHIGLELARRGHNVTVLTAYQEESNIPKNYHQILIDIDAPVKKEGSNMFIRMNATNVERFHYVSNRTLSLTEKVIKTDNFQNVVKENITFDLVIVEEFYQDALYALAHRYKAPLIIISLVYCMKHSIVLKNPLSLSTVTVEFLEIPCPQSFIGRLKNLYFTVYEYIWWKFVLLEKFKDAAKLIPNLEEPVPCLYDILRNTSLVLLNTHFSFSQPVAYLPNFVEIGGFHLGLNNNTIPDDLQKILDEAEHGVVYLNFGTLLRGLFITEDKRNILLNVFKRLKQTVLMKWENETLVNKPDNVIIRDWFPQYEILAHRNMKVFITHGGSMSLQETIHHGVPIIGLPIFGDQLNNLLKFQEIGCGKLLHYPDLTEKLLEDAIMEIIVDRHCKEKMVELSKVFNDRPMKPMETAMFWIEYVIRNKGANFAKNHANKLPWIAFQMIDVYAFVVVIFITILTIVYYLLRIIYSVLKRVKSLKEKFE